MTDQVAFRGSRRALLAAAVGAAAATATQALAFPVATRAVGDGDVVLGAENTSADPTRISNAGDASTVLELRAQGIGVEALSESGVAVVGVSGVGGPYPPAIDTTTGVYGLSLSGTGVYGASDKGPGVYAANHGTGVAASIGQGNDGTGVHGFTGDWEQRLTAPTATGVYGSASGSGTGVTGRSETGTSILGDAMTGTGVRGQATSGTGILGTATTGTAVRAVSVDPKLGYALRVIGRVRLDKCAGVASILAGHRSVLVTPGIELTAATASIVATLQGSAGGSTTVQRVALDAANNRFTIHLTAASTVDVKVAWHVFG